MDDSKANNQTKEEKHMVSAIELAKEALQSQEVPVGCIFVVNEIIVAGSRNTVNETRNPTRHAEINCIDKLLHYCQVNGFDWKDYFRDVVVYVTVEPCVMCATALIELGIKKLYYGCCNDRFGGETVISIKNLFDNYYNSQGGILAEEAMSLLKHFYKGTNPLAPVSKCKTKGKLISNPTVAD